MKLRLLTALVATVVTSMLFASPAGAVKVQRAGDFTYRSQVVDLGEGDFSGKQTGFTVSCPGQHVLGGGADASAQFVETNSSYPVDGSDADDIPDDGWRVYLDYRSGTVDSWARIYAICVRGRPQYERAATVVPGGGSQVKAVTAACDSGRLAAGGYLSSAGVFESTIDAAIPKKYSWRLYVRNDGDPETSGDLAVTAYAICTKRYDISLRQRSNETRVACRGRGRHVIGGGADPSYLTEAPDPQRPSVNLMFPADGNDPDRVPDDRWRAKLTSNPDFTTWAICGS